MIATMYLNLKSYQIFRINKKYKRSIDYIKTLSHYVTLTKYEFITVIFNCIMYLKLKKFFSPLWEYLVYSKSYKTNCYEHGKQILYFYKKSLLVLELVYNID